VPDPVIVSGYDRSLEQHAMREHGLIGRGGGMGNALYAIDYDSLPPEARTTITLIVNNGPFPYPVKDGSPFGNSFHDLPKGRYLEYTVPTPGAKNRGARRIVARLVTGQLFFTACHYERVQVTGGTKDQRTAARLEATESIDSQWRNGFYIVTGMPPALRDQIVQAIKAKSV
jgi:ribonuclease T1